MTSAVDMGIRRPPADEAIAAVGRLEPAQVRQRARDRLARDARSAKRLYRPRGEVRVGGDAAQPRKAAVARLRRAHVRDEAAWSGTAALTQREDLPDGCVDGVRLRGEAREQLLGIAAECAFGDRGKRHVRRLRELGFVRN